MRIPLTSLTPMLCLSKARTCIFEHHMPWFFFIYLQWFEASSCRTVALYGPWPIFWYLRPIGLRSVNIRKLGLWSANIRKLPKDHKGYGSAAKVRGNCLFCWGERWCLFCWYWWNCWHHFIMYVCYLLCTCMYVKKYIQQCNDIH